MCDAVSKIFTSDIHNTIIYKCRRDSVQIQHLTFEQIKSKIEISFCKQFAKKVIWIIEKKTICKKINNFLRNYREWRISWIQGHKFQRTDGERSAKIRFEWENYKIKEFSWYRFDFFLHGKLGPTCILSAFNSKRIKISQPISQFDNI